MSYKRPVKIQDFKSNQKQVYVKFKGYKNSFNSRINMKEQLNSTSDFFPEPYGRFCKNVKVELYISMLSS